MPASLLLVAAAVVSAEAPAAAHAPDDRPYRVDHRLKVTEFQRDRLDPTVFRSPPDSLHLEAHVPGNSYFRFAEVPVKGGKKYRLRFAALIARGGVGDFTVKVTSYQDTPHTWRVLDGGAVERPLRVVGRWENVVIDFTPPAETTTVAVTFRIDSPCDVGEMWIDDCSLVIAGQPITIGP